MSRVDPESKGRQFTFLGKGNDLTDPLRTPEHFKSNDYLFFTN